VPTLGNKITLAPASRLFSSKNTLEQVAANAAIYNLPPSGGWLTHFGLWVKYNTQEPKLALAAWLPTPGGLPGTLLARTDPIVVPVGFEGNIEAPIVWSNPTIMGDLPTTLRVDPGQQLLLGWVTSGGDVDVGLAAQPSVTIWRNNNATAIPVNPFDAPISTIISPPPAIYTTFVDSTKPTITQNFPLAGASLTNDAPMLTASIADIDQAPRGDGIGAYEVQLRQVGSPTFLVNDHVVTASAPLGDTIAYQYAGPDLVGGLSYEWAMRAQDMAGEWSDWSPFRAFSITNVGFVDVTSGASPTGKIDGDTALIDWTARWWHTSALPGTAVQVQIVNASGGIVKLGPQIAKAIAGTDDPPGTLFTVGHAEAGIGSISPGQALFWQISVRASNNVWSAFSTPVPFRTNAVPTTPSHVSPPDGFTSANYQRLVATSVDADADDVPLTDVVWAFEIFDVRDSVTRVAFATAYDPILGRASYQTDPTTVPHEGRYLWRVQGRDLSSGAFGLSAWSAQQAFTFGAGPVVTIDNPGVDEVQLTDAPRIDWHTDDDQTAYQVLVYGVLANGTRGAQVYGTLKKPSTDTFWDLPSGTLQNNTTYELQVNSWDDGDLLGSAIRRFSVQFGTVQGLADVTMTQIALQGDVEASTPSIVWTGTRYPTTPNGTAYFLSYKVSRWEIAKGRAASEVVLAQITNPLQLSLRDYHAPPNVGLSYAVSQRVQLATGPTPSAETLLTTLVSLQTPTVVSTVDPEGKRFPVMYLGKDWAFGGRRRSGSYTTWGADGVPSVAEAPGMQRLRSCTFTIMGDRNGGPMSLAARRAAIVGLIRAAGPLCVRDEAEQIFMRVADWSGRRGNIGQIQISLQLEEIAYREGILT
jgi:hypothetical protein